MHYVSQSMKANESGGRKNGCLLSTRSTAAAFFPLLLRALSPSAGRTSKHCSETSPWILQSSQLCESVGKPPTAYHPCLTHGSSAAGMYCRHKQCHLPEEPSTSNSVLYLSNSSEDQLSSSQNKEELNEYKHMLYTTTFTLPSQVFQTFSAHLITCWTWLDCSMVSSSNLIFINY